MKTIPILLFVFAICALPAICQADPGIPGAYVSGFIGVHVPGDTDVPSTDFLTNESFNDRVEFDPGINIGGTGGYDFGIVRLEGELSHKYSTIKTITDQTAGDLIRSPNGDLGVLAIMFNGFIDLHNNSQLTPYLGGGVGFASMYLSDTYGITTSGGISKMTLLYGAGNDTVFAYQVGAGLDIALNRRFSLDVGYRYFGTSRADFYSDLAISSSMKFESHTSTLGFRYRY
ncbi:MAG: porin family protein [Geobacteraceae bacterium]|nr:porin family protein [Geobacteraceae bacterium]NTW80426.1 porin family protein [Geobacteraceae bacterium]